MIRSLLIGLTALLAFGPLPVEAQEYPTKPITVIIPYGAGGGTDLTMRLVEPPVSKQLGQKLVLQNKPGAAGTIGHLQLIKSAPDGYTLAIVGVGSTAVSPHTSPVGYTRDDYLPLVQINTIPMMLVASPSSPFKSLKDVTDFARQHPPGRLKVGITSVGSWLHLAMLRLEKLYGVRFSYVPHKSTGDEVTALMGGHLDLANADLPSAGSKIKPGLVRPIGMFTKERLKDFPEVPTLREQGADVEAVYFNMMIAPKGTPDRIITILEAAFKKALADPEVLEKSKALGMQVEYLGPRASRERVDQYYEMAGALLQELGLKK